MSNVIADAYNAVKMEGDPDYAGLSATYREELETRADGVTRTGVAANPFEEKFKELSAKAKAKEDKTPLGTTNGLNESPNPPAAKPPVVENVIVAPKVEKPTAKEASKEPAKEAPKAADKPAPKK